MQTGRSAPSGAPSVLLLSTYPFQRPLHGGQLRTAEIARRYRESGFAVRSLALYEPEAYRREEIGPHDIAFPPAEPFRSYRGRKLPLINDVLAGEYAASDAAYPKIRARLPSHIEVIHIEQPWLLPLAERLRAEHAAALIYGSQNIEAPLKASILDSCGVRGADDVLEHIDMLERRAAASADLTLAVTADDMAALERFGARRLLLAPNGVKPWNASAERLAHWRARLPSSPWLLYVASAHPPNFTGFVDSIGASLACVPPTSRLVLAGGVGPHIRDLLAKSRWHAINLSRLAVLGILADDDLAAVKTLAHGFLLPIAAGGGSNLKTAEALYSGRHVLATPASMRGYERFLALPEVNVAGTPSEFQATIREVIAKAPTAAARDSAQLRASLLWEHTLAAVPEQAMQLIEERRMLA